MRKSNVTYNFTDNARKSEVRDEIKKILKSDIFKKHKE